MTTITPCRRAALAIALAVAAAGCTLDRDEVERAGTSGGGDDAGYPGDPDDVPDGGWFTDAGSWPDAGGPHDGGPFCDCSAITIEAVCLFSPGCTPLYVGVGCSCLPTGECNCTDWTFSRCE